MPKQQALNQALQEAVDRLAVVDLHHRCTMLGLGEPANGVLDLRLFGGSFRLFLDGLDLARDNGENARATDRLLLLHLLACETPLPEMGDLMSFRAFPGGDFYYQPFCSRTRDPLVKRFGNDVDALRQNLRRFDWEALAIGDVGARIHALGPLYVTLIYRLGDEEFSPTADILFDGMARRVLCAEDAAVMASRICIGLLR